MQNYKSVEVTIPTSESYGFPSLKHSLARAATAALTKFVKVHGYTLRSDSVGFRGSMTTGKITFELWDFDS